MAKNPRLVLQIAVAAVLAALGALGLVILTMNKPPLARKTPAVTHPAVRVVRVELKSRPVVVRGEGVAAPLRQSTLAAEVRGKVVFVSPALVSGGVFKKGQTLLRIDRRNYELVLALARAKVLEAETYLQKTREEAAAAWDEWKRFQRGRGAGEPSALVLKKPQLAEAKAKLEAARAQVAQAQLDLARTEIKAPYQGRVADKFVDLGQYLNAGQKIAVIFGVEAVEITVYLEDADLAWLHVPGLTEGGFPGSPALVTADFAGARHEWRGRVVRARGKLDERTRMVPVVVRVDKPYARRPPLIVGMFVEAAITGTALKNAAVLPRAALRQGGLVWVVDKKGVLHFRRVKTARVQNDQVLISQGLRDGEQVVLGSLPAVSDGMKVRVVQPAGGEVG